MIQFNLDTSDGSTASAPFSVSVIGIGGSGTNVIDKIALEGMPSADLVSMNCDARALNTSMAGTKLQLGKTLTQGLGCGGDPELGAEAAQASEGEIRQLLEGRNMVFICVGLGGGTASGAAPVVARMAREAGAFVVVFATLPFAFEGRRRSNQASLALQDLRKYANALVTFENDRMGELVVPKKGVQEAFELADTIIGQSVRAVTSLVTQPGLIHIGMDDLVTALRNTDSRCLFGYGQAKGENRAVEALGQALKSPLLDRGQMLSGARNVLVHICGGTTLTLFEIETLMRELGKHVHEDAQILFGAATDSRLQEHLSVTLLTSLGKPVPVAETAAPAVAEVPAEADPVVENPVPAIPALTVGETPVPVAEPAPIAEVETAVQAGAVSAAAPVEAAPVPEAPLAESPVVQEIPAQPVKPAKPPVAKTAAAAVVPVVAVAAPVLLIVEDELFPETVAAPVSAAPAVPTMETLLIEIPAVVAPAALRPIAIDSAPLPVAELLLDETEEKEEEEISMEEEAEVEPAPAVFMAEEEAAAVESEIFEEETEETVEPEMIDEEIIAQAPVPTPAPEPEPEPAPEEAAVPGRIIRPERQSPPPAARHDTAPPAKRFVLSDIIKRDPRPAPAADPIMEYEAAEEVEIPVVPVRPLPAPAPAARRTPDFDRVSPIRPIAAGRGTTPAPAASPFTAAKSASAPSQVHAHSQAPAPVPVMAQTSAPLRPVPTQQQTFDERLQPAGNGGRFERSKPTVEEGEDLDVPTFLRRKR